MWKMINYDVCGKRHTLSNSECIDKTMSLSKKGTSAIVLSQGDDGSSYSKEGAVLVTNTIAEFMVNNFKQIFYEDNINKVKESIIFRIRAALTLESTKLRCKIKDLSSNLVAVAVKNDSYIAIHLGSGIIGIANDSKVEVLSKPDTVEVDGKNRFVTGREASNNLRIYRGKISNIRGFILMSSGTGESFYYKEEELFSNGVKRLVDYTVLLPKEIMEEQLQESFDEIVSLKSIEDCSVAILANSKYSKQVYDELDKNDKLDLYDLKGLDEAAASKRMGKYEKILQVLSEDKYTVDSLAKKVYIKKKYIQRELDFLEMLGLVKETDMKYSSNINFKDIS